MGRIPCLPGSLSKKKDGYLFRICLLPASPPPFIGRQISLVKLSLRNTANSSAWENDLPFDSVHEFVSDRTLQCRNLKMRRKNP